MFDTPFIFCQKLAYFAQAHLKRLPKQQIWVTQAKTTYFFLNLFIYQLMVVLAWLEDFESGPIRTQVCLRTSDRLNKQTNKPYIIFSTILTLKYRPEDLKSYFISNSSRKKQLLNGFNDQILRRHHLWKQGQPMIPWPWWFILLGLPWYYSLSDFIVGI